MAKKYLKDLFPEIKKDEEKKSVEIKDNFFLSNLMEIYFTFKGYKVKNVPQFSKDKKHRKELDGTSIPSLHLEQILTDDFFENVKKCIAEAKPIPRDKFIEKMYRKPAPGLHFGRCDEDTGQVLKTAKIICEYLGKNKPNIKPC